MCIKRYFCSRDERRKGNKETIYLYIVYIYTLSGARGQDRPLPPLPSSHSSIHVDPRVFTLFFYLNHPFMTYFWSDLYHHCEKLPITNILWKAYSTYKYVQMGLIFDKMFACKFINCLFQNFHTYTYSSKIQLF